MFSIWFSYFFQLNFNKLMRRFCEKYVRRKVKNEQGVNLCWNFTLPPPCLCTPSFSPKVITWHGPVIQSKKRNSPWSEVNFKKYTTSMSSKPEPVIWSRDTSQCIACFDSCQLTITRIPKIKDVTMVMVLLL